MKTWILALAFPTLVWAYSPTGPQHCTPLDLRNETLGEVRNQKDVAWCYAFTSADMLAHAFDEKQKISAADVAIGYNETKIGRVARWLAVNVIDRKDPETRKLAHQTGFTKAALVNAMRDGWCPESVFPSEAWTRMARTENGWESTQVPLASAMLEIASLHEKRNQLTSENLPYYYSFKNVGSQEFIKLLQTKKVAGFYSNLRKAVCRDDRHAFNYNWKVKMVFKHPRIFSRISEQLERGRPVGLDYDSRILPNGSNRGVKLAELHTSPIVGRRWNQERNTCEYLIRNSYGESCETRYDQSHACEEGNIWLSESQIYRNMTSIVYMLSR